MVEIGSIKDGANHENLDVLFVLRYGVRVRSSKEQIDLSVLE